MKVEAPRLVHGVLHFCGPTNSGKTYHALNALCQHTSGKFYTLRLWFAFQYADAEDIELLEQRRDAANTTIEGFLRAKAKHHRKRCRVCERVLPRFSSYGICQRCFTSGRRA